MNPVNDLFSSPHRRLNPLTGEWVLVSPHRTRRPWQGQVEKAGGSSIAAYDPGCYLCPGNARAGGKRNPDYSSTFVFDNDFAALYPGARGDVVNTSDLLVAGAEAGLCRVVCYSPNHGLTLSCMERPAIRRVVDVWAEQYQELGSLDFIDYVQVFENRGEMMGCSNPHPHGQIWATSTLPNEPAKELRSQQAYARSHGSCLLCDYLRLELSLKERLVAENACFVALVPYWAVWPFETLVLPRRHFASLELAQPDEREALAGILKRLTTRYDNLFQTSFPYSMGFHQRPVDGPEYSEWHLHAHFYPPLLRSATVRKFMVGFEMLATPQRDITPESAAERLRALEEK